MDPVAYSSLPSDPQPSAPPVDTVVHVTPAVPVPLTIRVVDVRAGPNRQWFGYCVFIIVVVLSGASLFYYMIFGHHKN